MNLELVRDKEESKKDQKTKKDSSVSDAKSKKLKFLQALIDQGDYKVSADKLAEAILDKEKGRRS